MKNLVTGAAGFIGSHVCLRLLQRGDDVIGLDNLNNYYSVALKKDRLKRIDNYRQSNSTKNQSCGGFEFVKMDLADCSGIETLFKDSKFEKVVNRNRLPPSKKRVFKRKPGLEQQVLFYPFVFRQSPLPSKAKGGCYAFGKFR